jgi:hypothetical protein
MDVTPMVYPGLCDDGVGQDDQTVDADVSFDQFRDAVQPINLMVALRTFHPAFARDLLQLRGEDAGESSVAFYGVSDCHEI